MEPNKLLGDSHQPLDHKDTLVDINDFVIQKQIDTNTIGQIYKVINKKTEEILLVKHISDDMSSKSNEISTIIKKTSKLCHPSILKYIGYSPIDFEKKSNPMIFVENTLILTLNDIFQCCKLNDIFDDTFKLIILYGIASAMTYLHSLDTIHEKLNPSNILFSIFFLPKFAPFFFPNDKPGENTSNKNSSIYISPETLQKSNISKSSNVYSFGTIAFELMTQKDPSELKNSSNLLNIAPTYKDLIERCCSKDPKNRPSFDNILSQLKSDHGFITEKVNEKDFIDYVNYIDMCKNDKKIDKFINLKSKTYSKFNETISYFDKYMIKPEEKSKFINLDRFYIIKNIGCGSFSSVFQVKEIATNKIYAAKILKEKLSDNYMNDEKTLLLYREIKLLSILDHPAVIEFIGFSPIDFKQSMHPTIITEYLKNGTLHDILNLERSGLSPKHWDDTKKLIIIYGIASGMLYLHSNDIIHRDLKPENILIDKHLQPKISDFGLSKAIKSTAGSLFKGSLFGCKGTPLYMPPETLKDYVYSKSGDVFAFSLIVYQILTLNDPYPSINIIDLYKKVAIEGQRPILSNDISKAFKNLIESCWSSDPDKRPTFKQIVNDLKTNEAYISETINESEFFNYVDFVDNAKTSFNLNQSIRFAQLAKENRKQKEIIRKNSSFNKTSEEEEEIEDLDINKSIEKFEFKIKGKETNVYTEIDKNTNTKKLTNMTKNIKKKPNKDENKKEIEKSSLKRRVAFCDFDKIIENESDETNIASSNNKMKELNETDITGLSNKIKELDEIDIISPSNEINELGEIDIANSNNEIKEMNELDEQCQNNSQKSHDEEKSLFIIGKDLIEGLLKCDQNIENGIKNLEKAITLNCTEAIIYYCNLLIEGKMIPRNIEKAKLLIEEKFDKKDSNALVLLGKILIHEKKYSKAIKKFKKSAKKNNLEAMYEYGKMLFFGKGCEKNDAKAMKYFHLSKLQGYEDSIKFLIIYQEINQIFSFTMLDMKMQLFFISEIISHSLARIHIPSNKNLVEFEKNLSKISSNKPNKSMTSIESIARRKTFYKGKWDKVVFKPKKAKKLFLNNMHRSKHFSEMLTYFRNVIIQIEIDTCKSSSIRDKIIKYENNFNAKIELSIIGNSMTSIDPCSLKCCSNLTRISIPPSVTSIGESAFCDCSNLTQISIPSSVTSIGKRAFSGCFLLEQISIPSSVILIESFLFKGCSSLEQILISSSVTSIGEGAFCGCSSLEQISIPSSVKLIEAGAFCDCSFLKEIVIPSSVTSIEPYLFKNCSSLVQVSIASSITSIKEGAFFGCISLTQISIPSSVKIIEKGAFLGCKSLTQITIPNSITAIEMTTFKKCSSLTQISIPNSVTSIGEAAFCECSLLNQIQLPYVAKIGELAFYKCIALTQITIPSSVKYIENDTFCNCSLLEKITIPSSVLSIGNCSFSRCNSLAQITIPSSVKSIGYKAFYLCTSLEQIEIPSSVKSIGTNAFFGCSSLTQIILPSSIDINSIVLGTNTMIKRI